MKTYAKIVIIPGKPIPLQRPRFRYKGAYDSQKTLKEEVSDIIIKQTDFPPASEHLSIELNFFMQMPKGHGKKKRAELAGQPHTSRPDIDNLIKFYLDVCNGLLYDDDSQIYNIQATKTYSEDARTEIIIKYGEKNGIQK